MKEVKPLHIEKPTSSTEYRDEFEIVKSDWRALKKLTSTNLKDVRLGLLESDNQKDIDLDMDM